MIKNNKPKYENPKYSYDKYGRPRTAKQQLATEYWSEIGKIYGGIAIAWHWYIEKRIKFYLFKSIKRSLHNNRRKVTQHYKNLGLKIKT